MFATRQDLLVMLRFFRNSHRISRQDAEASMDRIAHHLDTDNLLSREEYDTLLGFPTDGDEDDSPELPFAVEVADALEDAAHGR